jgi:NADP-dependent 3-hydroxy acid dehydrogenase YdfG
VVIVARDAERLARAQAELESISPGCVVAESADVRDGAEMTLAAQRGFDRFGAYGIVVASAAGNFSILRRVVIQRVLGGR